MLFGWLISISQRLDEKYIDSLRQIAVFQKAIASRIIGEQLKHAVRPLQQSIRRTTNETKCIFDVFQG